MHIDARALRVRLGFLTVFGFVLAAPAQKADLPAAPNVPSVAPASPSSQPDFHVPSRLAVTPGDAVKETPPPPPAPTKTSACEQAMTVMFAENPKLKPPSTPALKLYISEAAQHFSTAWKNHMPRSASDPWISGKIVEVRLLIEPDGSVEDVEMLSSSGRRDYDHHVLDAISASAPFRPLPAGVNQPVPLCFTLGYNVDPGKPLDLWPPKSTQKTPADSAGTAPSSSQKP